MSKKQDWTKNALIIIGDGVLNAACSAMFSPTTTTSTSMFNFISSDTLKSFFVGAAIGAKYVGIQHLFKNSDAMSVNPINLIGDVVINKFTGIGILEEMVILDVLNGIISADDGSHHHLECYI